MRWKPMCMHQLTVSYVYFERSVYGTFRNHETKYRLMNTYGLVFDTKLPAALYKVLSHSTLFGRAGICIGVTRI